MPHKGRLVETGPVLDVERSGKSDKSVYRWRIVVMKLLKVDSIEEVHKLKRIFGALEKKTEEVEPETYGRYLAEDVLPI